MTFPRPRGSGNVCPSLSGSDNATHCQLFTLMHRNFPAPPSGCHCVRVPGPVSPGGRSQRPERPGHPVPSCPNSCFSRSKMSLPLTRRIARAALLVAVGASPVVGAAGSAGAVEIQDANPLSAVSAMDTMEAGGLSATADHTGEQASQALGAAGEAATQQAVPTAGRTLGQAGEAAGPTVRETANDTATTATTTAGTVLGGTAGTAAEALGNGAPAPAAGLIGGLPAQVTSPA
ncbi:hypothetical protein SSCG_01306 [Streptomyces clavuligerus]|nr:hypothetical protein SSCG_01306 [Streptomyces clavuligerus]